MPFKFVLHISILPFCQINEKMSIPKQNLNKPTDGLVNLMNQFNSVTDDEKENELNLPNLPKILKERHYLFSI